VQGIADLIVRPGLINVDFADVRTVMSEMGLAMMGTGTARGDDRAQAAAEAAIQNPLLDDVNLAGANGILVNITAGADFTMAEFDEIGRTIDGFASEDATVVVGTVLDPDMQDEVRVTVVATGLNRAVAAKSQRPGERAPIKLVRNATTGQPEFGDFDNGGDAVSKAVGGMGLGLRRPSADTVTPSGADTIVPDSTTRSPSAVIMSVAVYTPSAPPVFVATTSYVIVQVPSPFATGPSETVLDTPINGIEGHARSVELCSSTSMVDEFSRPLPDSPSVSVQSLFSSELSPPVIASAVGVPTTVTASPYIRTSSRSYAVAPACGLVTSIW